MSRLDYEPPPLPFGTDADLRACSLTTWEGDPSRCRWCDAELPKGRRRWCSNACSTAHAINHWWNAARHAAKMRDGWRCVRPACEDRRSLEVHHTTPILGRHAEGGCHHHQDGLETLCGTHHHQAHHGERRTAQIALPIVRPPD